MKCDEGYVCIVCSADVEAITDSDLYLRYILGDIPLEQLHLRPECHIRCHPELAQFIVDAGFAAVICEGPFAKANLDAEYVVAEEVRVTRAWRRLQEVPALGIAITDYPITG
ncbi:MAG TPA: hypothetical protein VKS79_09915 [Gemmataceae bacterium]|nr:hypothetical protein [Gemmataceae bacterium]